MYKEILDIIKEYDSIIITRHCRPDMDALGSQFGLKQLLLDNFKDKKIYAIGDLANPCMLGTLDEVTEDIIKNSLMIITDVSVKEMLPDIKYPLAKKVICIDHHRNDCNIENAKAFYDTSASAACQIIAEFAFENNLILTKECAKCLYTGIITDTNRFNFSLSPKLFVTTSKLIETGFDYQDLYNELYSSEVENVKMRAYFIEKFVVNEYGVAYIKSDASIFDKFKVDFFLISRGMVSVMANLKGVDIWANFTQDPVNHKIVCEFRSKQIIILPIAKKYGGGGHNLACGATVDSFEVVDKIIEEFNLLVKEN